MPPSTMRWDSLAMNLQGTLMLPGAPHYVSSSMERDDHLAGAVTRGSDDDSAVELRRHPYVVNVIAAWPSPRDDFAAIEWVRKCGDGFAGQHPRRLYINFSGADPTDADVAFDERVLAHLRRIKCEYDPAALFG